MAAHFTDAEIEAALRANDLRVDRAASELLRQVKAAAPKGGGARAAVASKDESGDAESEDEPEEYDFRVLNSNKERVLVGETIAMGAKAGQICRELSVQDYGIDMEMEFRYLDNDGAHGSRIYLQLKSGGSYSDAIQLGPGHAQYWVNHPGDVYLVVRDGTTEGSIKWCNVTDYLLRYKKVFKDWPTRIPNSAKTRELPGQEDVKVTEKKRLKKPNWETFDVESIRAVRDENLRRPFVRARVPVQIEDKDLMSPLAPTSTRVIRRRPSDSDEN